MENNWLEIDSPEGRELLKSSSADKLEVKFDNGETADYRDEWPFAEVTHVKLK